MKIIEVNASNFEEVTKEGTILLDFWASWCGPCRMLGPVLEELSETENITIGKVNVDVEEDLAIKFGISSIPALFLMKDGKVLKSTVGYQPLEELRNFIK